jgi:hypothetical protein
MEATRLETAEHALGRTPDLLLYGEIPVGPTDPVKLPTGHSMPISGNMWWEDRDIVRGSRPAGASNVPVPGYM